MQCLGCHAHRRIILGRKCGCVIAGGAFCLHRLYYYLYITAYVLVLLLLILLHLTLLPNRHRTHIHICIIWCIFGAVLDGTEHAVATKLDAGSRPYAAIEMCSSSKIWFCFNCFHFFASSFVIHRFEIQNRCAEIRLHDSYILLFICGSKSAGLA